MTLVVVEIIKEMEFHKLSIQLKLRFSEVEEKFYLLKAAIEEIIKKVKSNLKKRISKMLLTTIASYMEEKPSLEIQDSLGALLRTMMITLTDMVRNLVTMPNLETLLIRFIIMSRREMMPITICMNSTLIIEKKNIPMP